MDELIKNAKLNKIPFVLKNYKQPTITWEDLLLFLYKETVLPVNQKVLEAVKQVNDSNILNVVGNVQVQDNFWLAPMTTNLFNEFKDVQQLLLDLNKFKEDASCGYYNGKPHTCNLDWHTQGIKISLSNRKVSKHNDAVDVFYWQIIGQSFWKIDENNVYTLNPGDLFYLPSENSHEVWCYSPRAGLLIENLNR